MQSPAWTHDVISFGPFELAPRKRLLSKSGVPVPLGARALDILITLTARAPEIVSKRDLLAATWPDTVVDEGSLRFQIAALRKALNGGEPGARYVTTIAGRGYCFVAPISGAPPAEAPPPGSQLRHASLPSRPLYMLGRSAEACALSAQLQAVRFVTLVGSGGVGKTTLAVSVGHDLAPAFDDAVLFVDLGSLSDPTLIATNIASLAGLAMQSAEATPTLLAYLRDKRMLLVLDTCEHLVEAVAALAERIVAAAPAVHLLATSREALRARGEHVFTLGPLACPPDGTVLTPSSLRTYPATELFLKRATAGGADPALDDEDAAVIASMCHKLDGVALAIELVAGRVAAFGLQLVAALLEQRLALLWPGQRTAPPRQRTLQATLDWSYGLLSPEERIVLRRLAVFRGHFTIDSVLEVVASPEIDRSIVFVAVDSLVAKSILAARPVGAMMRYRLLDTTRAYVLELAGDEAEVAEIAVRHAAYYARWLEEAGTRWPGLSSASERAVHLAALSNVRAALEWCFAPGGHRQAGVTLASAAAPVLLAMSLLPEAQRWSERALAVLEEGAAPARAEMRLQAALGVSLMFLHGGDTAARQALERSLAIALDGGDPSDQIQILAALNMFHLRFGDFRTALGCARRCSAMVGTMHHGVSAGLAYSISGMSLHLSGELAQARAALEAALRPNWGEQRTATIYLGFEGQSLASAILARTLWLQGYAEQACACAHQTVAEAASMDHKLTLAIALIWAISVFLWNGDLGDASHHLGLLTACAESHSLAPYLLVARGFEGMLAVRHGKVSEGVASLRVVLQDLHGVPYELLTTPFSIALAEGLILADQPVEAIQIIEKTTRQIEIQGDHCYSPELLRLRAAILLAQSNADQDEAESYLRRGLEQSRAQGARAWELRTGIDLARLWATQNRKCAARTLLVALLQTSDPGLQSADHRAASSLLATIQRREAESEERRSSKG